MTEFNEIKEKKTDHMDIPRLLNEKIIKENIIRNRQKRPKGLNADGFMQKLGMSESDEE